MKTCIVFFLILCSQNGWSVSALKRPASAPDCAAILTESTSNSDLYDLLRLSDFNEYSTVSSVHISTSSRKIYGHRLKTLTRVGEVWESTHQSHPNAPEMDPRGFIIALGPTLAAQFGCQMLSDRQMTSTTPAVLTDALQIANACIEKRTGLAKAFSLYFVTPKTKFLSNRKYVIYFIHSLMPIAPSGSLYLHDLQHALAFLIPPRFIQFAQYQSQTMVNFEKFVNSHNPRLAKSPGVEAFFNRMYDEEARRIDHGTGNFGIALSRRDFHTAAIALGPLVEYGMPPADIIMNLIQYSTADQSFGLPQAQELMTELREFSRRMTRKSKSNANPYQDMYEGLVVTENEIKTRIETLDTALRMVKNH